FAPSPNSASVPQLFLLECFGNVIRDDGVSRRSRHDDLFVDRIEIHDSAIRPFLQRTWNCQDRLPGLSAIRNVPDLYLTFCSVVIDQTLLRSVDRADAACIHDSPRLRVSYGGPVEDQNFAFTHRL